MKSKRGLVMLELEATHIPSDERLPPASDNGHPNCCLRAMLLTWLFNEQYPQTRQVVQGYYITAYRNLTTVSITFGLLCSVSTASGSQC